MSFLCARKIKFGCMSTEYLECLGGGWGTLLRVLYGAPRYPGVLATLVPSVTER